MAAIGHLNPGQITADLNAVADYGLKLPAATKKLFRRGLLLGRRPNLSLRDQSSGPRRRPGILRTAAR
jgi:hypothetical protein